MEDSTLNYILDPSDIEYYYNTPDKDLMEKSKEHSKKLREKEKEYFNEICNELSKDMQEIGLSLTFSSKIIIRKVALNVILLRKVILQSSLTALIREIPKNTIHAGSTFKSLSVDMDIHPFFEKTIFKLQKQINEELKQLGLLPVQQIERQKLTIIKKLRQRYESIDKECIIKAEAQKNFPNKKKNQVQEINAT